MWSIILKWLLVLLPLGLMIFLFSQKGKLEQYVSGVIKSQNNTGSLELSGRLIDSLYNHQKNGSTYRLTFLEFGAKGCVACRKMEFVLDEVRQEYPGKVKVVFLNILEPQNQDLMKYYGIVAIPTQVLLDDTGEEYFKHTGYCPSEDLRKVFENKLAYDK